MYNILLTFITSFLIVLLFTPSLIKVAELKKLLDEPGERKSHKFSIPSLGGIIIFAATIFSYALWFPSEIFENTSWMNADFKYIIATIFILFFIGVKDDVVGTDPIKKLIGHILVALILVLMADIRLTSMHGIFGIHEIPEWAGIFLSLFAYIVIVNSFNLIDGVDGVAAGIGLIASIAYGVWFYLAGDITLSCLAFTLGGSLLGFLIFNFSPAKIFMGDSGALTIGLILSILSIKLIEFPQAGLPDTLRDISNPVFALAVLAYPLYDTLRVFIYRAVKKGSPFLADKRHIHHRILKIGLTHRQTALTLYAFNILIILLAVFSKGLEPNYSLIITAGAAIIIGQIPFIMKKKNV